MLELSLAERTLKTDRKAFVMGILNVTPDSFYEQSRGGVERAFQLIEEGIDILDIGCESTRPGSSYISEEEELKRLIPVLKEIRKDSDIAISIDTRKKNVMEAAYYEGADILNDVSAMEDDSLMASFCSEKKLPVILMHEKEEAFINEEDYFNKVRDYLFSRVDYAKSYGISDDKIILDPGIGFNKDLKQNLTLIKNCGKLGKGLYPVLMALSRKRCIGEMTGRELSERLAGTLTADIVSILNGASLVRVHDVKETIDTLNVLKYTV